MKGATLYIPPPSSGLEQMTRSNVQITKEIANARIHVERSIGTLSYTCSTIMFERRMQVMSVKGLFLLLHQGS